MFDSLIETNAARIAILILVFLAVVIITMLVAARIGERREVRSRLAGEPGGCGKVGVMRP